MTRISRLALVTLLSVNTVFAADGANPLTGLPLPDTATGMFVGFINISATDETSLCLGAQHTIPQLSRLQSSEAA